MPAAERPEISVILSTDSNFQLLQRAVGYLRRQTVAGKVELVIAAPSKENLGLDQSALEGLFGCQVVEVGTGRAHGESQAEAVRAASAPVVALLEEHTYVDPGYAEAMIKAHQGPYAGVGPVVRNANPLTSVSWTGYVLPYSVWLEPREAGLIDDLPGNKSSYKKDLILAFGPELGPLLNAQPVMHWELRAKGYQLYFEPAAITYHLHIAFLGALMEEQFLFGRTTGGNRARSWSLARKLLYILGSPLIPLVRLVRTARHVRRSNLERGRLVRMLPSTILALLASAAGEAVGFSFGPGRAAARLAKFEFGREKYITEADRQALENWSMPPAAIQK